MLSHVIGVLNLIIEKNVWILRPMPHGTNRMRQFLDDNFIAIGYPTGTSFKGKSYEELKDLLERENWSEGIGNVNLFVLMMNVGDYIIVPDDNKRDVYIGEITSDYYHQPNVDTPNEGLYPHQRKVKWFFDKKPLLRSQLPEKLRGSLRYPGTIANITKHRSIVENLINVESHYNDDEKNSDILNKAIQVLEELLEDRNSEIRLKAAEIIVGYYSTKK
jgi:restriction system protein